MKRKIPSDLLKRD